MLKTSHPDILNFYKQHKKFDFEELNLVFIHIINKLKLDITNNSITTRMLKELTHKVDRIENSQETQSQNINTILNMLQNMQTVLSSQKDFFIEEFKTIMENSTFKTNEKTQNIIEKHNSQLLDKIHILFSDIIPEENTKFYDKLSEHISNKYDSLYENLNTGENINVIITKLFSELKSSITRDIYSFISNNNSSLLNEMQEQSKKYADIHDFLQKQKYCSPCVTGKLGENRLELILNECFPYANVENTASVGKSGDFILNREGFKNNQIMFENKEYSSNVPDTEVRKFIRDIEHLNCSGVFLSQTSGIVNKKHLEINFHNNNILIYLHNVNYDADLIKLSIQIIDNISEKIDLSSIDTKQIPIDILDNIQTELMNFALQKKAIIDMTKTYQQKMMASIDNLNFPTLSRFLSKFYSNIEFNNYNCNYCNFAFKNKRALSAHLRGCKIKKNGGNNIIITT